MIAILFLASLAHRTVHAFAPDNYSPKVREEQSFNYIVCKPAGKGQWCMPKGESRKVKK